MIHDSVKITLLSKYNPSIFHKTNIDVLGEFHRRLGSNHSATKTMIMDKAEMLKGLMPPVLNMKPNDPLWEKTSKNYWDSISLIIPTGGKELETGLRYDLDDTIRITAIKALFKEHGGDVTLTDKVLKKLVQEKVNHENQWRYAQPINVEDYLYWSFALIHSEVANTHEDLTKSTKIKFTLVDPRLVQEAKRTTHNIADQADKLYFDIISDRNKVANVLVVLGNDITDMPGIDRDILLKSSAKNTPTKFIAICEDVNLLTRATIERYIVKGILKRLNASSIIVDVADPGIVIGNNLDEAVSYFNSESADKIANVKMYNARYKQLTDKNKNN